MTSVASKRGTARKRRARRKSRWLLGVLVVLVLGTLSWASLYVWGRLPGAPEALVTRRVELSSESSWAAAHTLADAGLTQSPLLFFAYLRLVTPGATLVAREHWIGGNRTPRQLVMALSERGGDVATVALPEGRTSFELATRLEHAGVCRASAFLAATRDPALLARFDIPVGNAEGYLFPESHELRLDERPERVLATFLREGQRRRRALEEELPLTDLHRALGFGWNEVVILASIVERETGNRAERPRIARVFLNRLLAPTGETGGRLESDPTAVYGCQALGTLAPASCARSGGAALPALLKDEQNPYGTYRRAGLPPGPIGNPGEASLRAVLRPATGDELYFVADGRGNHHFSRTFAEHRQAVERLKALRRKQSPESESHSR